MEDDDVDDVSKEVDQRMFRATLRFRASNSLAHGGCTSITASAVVFVSLADLHSQSLLQHAFKYLPTSAIISPAITNIERHKN